MNDIVNIKPSLLFFRDTPNNLVSLPPLASSLQHLETSYLMIAMNRFPHALINCGSAIESAIKAAIKASPDDRIDFRGLINKGQQKFPDFTKLSSKAIKKFRLKRNQILHYGFSPKDDEESAILLLETGYNLIEDCYESFFNFPLHSKGTTYGGLALDFDRQLKVAKNVYCKVYNNNNLNLAYCFISFSHQLRWSLRGWMLSDW